MLRLQGVSDFLLSLLAEKLYKGTLVIVKWKDEYAVNAAVTDFKKKVLEVKNVHVFDAA